MLAPIFHGNRITSEVNLRKAQLERIMLDYRAALLRALSEVEDALVSGQELSQQVELLQQQVRAAEGARRLSTDQYTQGLVSFLQVLTAEQSVYLARRELIAARRELVLARVQLARALGGGWMVEELEKQKKNGGVGG